MAGVRVSRKLGRECADHLSRKCGLDGAGALEGNTAGLGFSAQAFALAFGATAPDAEFVVVEGMVKAVGSVGAGATDGDDVLGGMGEVERVEPSGVVAMRDTRRVGEGGGGNDGKSVSGVGAGRGSRTSHPGTFRKLVTVIPEPFGSW